MKHFPEVWVGKKLTFLVICLSFFIFFLLYLRITHYSSFERTKITQEKNIKPSELKMIVLIPEYLNAAQ